MTLQCNSAEDKDRDICIVHGILRRDLIQIIISEYCGHLPPRLPFGAPSTYLWDSGSGSTRTRPCGPGKGLPILGVLLARITVCPGNRVNEAKLPSIIKQYWNVEPTDDKYEYYKHFINVLAYTNKFNLADLAQFKTEDLDVDLFQLIVDVTPELDIKATWSVTKDIVKWYPIMSEAGLCFSTNTVALVNDAIVKPNASEKAIFPLTCKYSSLNCYVNIEVHNVSDVKNYDF
ncbi:uncharacterized protein [Choristoneura fumiferana]|uniref:uncharacterized protein n=1 Tax=Choristoneura fumiferana TaxID=7141 RepID=UPI003D15B3E4